MSQAQIFKILTRKHGIRLTAAASRYLSEIFQEITDESVLMENLDFIAHEWVHLQDEHKSKILEREGLEELLGEISKKRSGQENVGDSYQQLQVASNYLAVLDTFSVPMYQYNIDDKAFVLRKEVQSVFAAHNFKTHRYRDRFDLLLQRLLRQPSFRPPVHDSANADTYYQLTPISNLRGKATGQYLIFGMLTQIEDGKLHIEDLNGNLELKFVDNVLKSSGIFTQNCFVIVEGLYDQNGVDCG